MAVRRGVSRVAQLVFMALALLLIGAGPAYAVPPISYQEVVVRKLVNAAGGEVLYRQGYYGIVSAYWEGFPRECPEWINRAFG